MSIKKIIAAVISFLFLLMLASTLLLSLHNFRSYLIEQTVSQTQNAANILAFNLSQYSQKDNLVTMQTMINAVFETGNYKAISIRTLDGKDIITKKAPELSNGIPGWFINLVDLSLKPAIGNITEGWKQFGYVVVYSKTSLAYQKLWITSIELLSLFALMFVITLIIFFIAMRFLLKPLDKVKQQAENISEKKFTIVGKLPWAKELRSVVEVMNHLSLKVSKIFTEQAALIERLRNQAYRETLTKLGNRRFFDMELASLLRNDEKGFSGTLFLLEIQGVEKIKKTIGYQASDEFLIKVSDVLNNISEAYSYHLVCRLNDKDFAILIDNVSPLEATKLAQRLVDEVNLVIKANKNLCKVHVGVAQYQQNQNAVQLLSNADMSLRAAQSKGDNTWYMYEFQELEMLHIRTATQWREILQKVIVNKSVLLYFQPVYSSKNQKEIMQYEVLMRLTDDNGSILPAAEFFPMAENLGLTPELDKLVVSKVLTKIQHDKLKHEYAINLSIHSMKDIDFMDWVIAKVAENAELAKYITFEIPEQIAISQLDKLKLFVSKVDQYGASVAIDQFGRAFSSIHYLQNLNIQYLKVNGSFTKDIERNSENQFFVRTLTAVAHNLDIEVIATNIETREEMDTLKDFGMDGLQGYYLAEPTDKV